jgi:hypothetical protein
MASALPPSLYRGMMLEFIYGITGGVNVSDAAGVGVCVDDSGAPGYR